MFEALLALTAVVAVLAMLITFDGNGDIFHPLFFICPMFLFLYVWMPWKLDRSGALDSYFDRDQLVFLQTLYLLGVLTFVIACLAGGWQVARTRFAPALRLALISENRLILGGGIIGSIGLAAWFVAIKNVGGFTNASANRTPADGMRAGTCATVLCYCSRARL